MSRIPIEARTVLLCENAELRNEIWTLENPLLNLVAPAGGSNKFVVDSLVLYTQLTGGLGKYTLTVQFRNFESDIILGQGKPIPIEFSEQRDDENEQVIRLENIQFVRPGLYEFSLFANHIEVVNGAAYLKIFSGE